MTPTLIDFDRTYTLDEFLNLDLPGEEDDSIIYELIEGKIVGTPRSGIGGQHGEVILKLATPLDLFAGPNAPEQKGRLFTNASVRLNETDPKSSWVQPDLCFVLKDRIPERFDGPLPALPDIVVEVWSPSDDTEKIQTKIEAYRKADVPLIWSVYMLNRFILIYRQGQTYADYLTPEGTLTAEPILPGFRLGLDKLFW